MALRLCRRVAAPRLVRGAVHRCAASRGGGRSEEREALLRGVLPEHRDVVGRALEQAAAAVDRWEVALTDFLEPPAASDCALAVRRLADAEARPWGGHEHAERVRLRLGRAETLDAEPVTDCCALLAVEGSFMFDAATHRRVPSPAVASSTERC
jgi:RNA-binding protein YlmH